MSNLTPEDNQTSLIPDFFHEFISRIIPGLAAIAAFLYWSKGDIKSVFSNVGLSVFVLVAAWIVGVALDIGAYVVVKQIFSKKYLKKAVPDLEAWWTIRKLTPWERGVVSKSYAQVVFLRSMMLICAFAAFICLLMFLETYLKLDSCMSALDSFLPALHDHHQRYGVFCGLLAWLFYICWKAHRIGLEEWMKKAEHRTTELQTSRGD